MKIASDSEILGRERAKEIEKEKEGKSGIGRECEKKIENDRKEV